MMSPLYMTDEGVQLANFSVFMCSSWASEKETEYLIIFESMLYPQRLA